MKTTQTLDLENKLFKYLQGIGKYCVFECQLSNYLTQYKRISGKKVGIVDCICINTDEIVYCYELKVTKSDFHSKNGHNFFGHYNYYVMPNELFEEIKEEIPTHIGVLVPYKNTLKSVKKSKKQILELPFDDIKDYMFRSLYREYQKYFPQRY